MINLKLAFRTLFRAKFVTVVAILSLALGIGANAAIFSIFNQMLLSALPVQKPKRAGQPRRPGPEAGLASRATRRATASGSSATRCSATCEKMQTVFSGIAAHRIFGANLSFGGQTMTGEGMLVSGNYFPLLGVQPALGRLLNSGTTRRSANLQSSVLSHAYWTSRFGQRPTSSTRQMIVNGQTMTIVGVAPPGIRRDDAWRDPRSLRARSRCAA